MPECYLHCTLNEFLFALAWISWQVVLPVYAYGQLACSTCALDGKQRKFLSDCAQVFSSWKGSLHPFTLTVQGLVKTMDCCKELAICQRALALEIYWPLNNNVFSLLEGCSNGAFTLSWIFHLFLLLFKQTLQQRGKASP